MFYFGVKFFFAVYLLLCASASKNVVKSLILTHLDSNDRNLIFCKNRECVEPEDRSLVRRMYKSKPDGIYEIYSGRWQSSSRGKFREKRDLSDFLLNVSAEKRARDHDSENFSEPLAQESPVKVKQQSNQWVNYDPSLFASGGYSTPLLYSLNRFRLQSLGRNYLGSNNDYEKYARVKL